MTGRKSNRKAVAKQQAQQQKDQQQQQQSQHQPRPAPVANQMIDESIGSPPANVRREQPPPTQIVKKILKAENDEANTLKIVFKSDPNTQMKEFIKKAAKPTPQTVKQISKTPAEAHPPAVAQVLLDTDDDVADNLAKLFKSSKSYKNI